MKNTTLILKSLLFAFFVFTFIACEDDTDSSGDDGNSSKYAMSLRTLGANDESSDYLLTLDSLMGSDISAEGQGIELVGWNYTNQFGGKVFTFGYDLNECIGYTLMDGELQEEGKFAFDRMDVLGPIDNDYFLAIGAPWGGGSFDCQLQVIDINDISISNKVLDPIYVSYDPNNMETQLNAWPTASYLDGDKIYVSFYPLNGESWETPNTDTAYVSVYSYPELEYIKTMKDDRTGPIGYYGAQPCILSDELGDHYTISSCAISAGFTQATKTSAILKIDANTDEFNSSYFFDVQSSGYKVTSAAYVADGLAVAKVISTEMDAYAGSQSAWALFSEVTPILNIAVIDLYNKTVTIVDDVPLHGGQYQTPFLVEDGMAYVSVNNGLEAHVYQVDAENATATKGAKLIGNQFQGLFSIE